MHRLTGNPPPMKKFFPIRYRRAMTLTELIIAIALVGISVGGIVSVLLQTVDLSQSIDNSYVATDLARNRIERIRSVRRDMGYAAIPESAETDTIIDRNGNADQNGVFKRTTIINASYGTNLTRVTVRVTYKRRGSFLSTPIEVTSLISPYT